MKCCTACHTVVLRLYGPVEEKSGPGAIIGKYRCAICWKGFDVQADQPHNLNAGGVTAPGDFEVITAARKELGIVVDCPQCEREADIAAGKAIKANIVFHNCGRPNS